MRISNGLTMTRILSQPSAPCHGWWPLRVNSEFFLVPSATCHVDWYLVYPSMPRGYDRYYLSILNLGQHFVCVLYIYICINDRKTSRPESRRHGINDGCCGFSELLSLFETYSDVRHGVVNLNSTGWFQGCFSGIHGCCWQMKGFRLLSFLRT